MSIPHALPAIAAALILAATPAYMSAQPTDNPEDANWSGQFGAPGMGSGGSAAYVANDRLYLLGFIPVIQSSGGSSRALYATWDGTAWSGRDVFGDFLQNEGATELLVIGTDVYAAGNFSNVGGTAASNIARWDGEKWNALGSGVNGRINAMATDGNGNVYVGGVFTEAGGLPARNVAVWNGDSWSNLPNPGGANDGVGGGVTAIAVSNTHVYVGGAFQEAGSESAVSIASWNWTTNEWRGLGGGLRKNLFPNATGLTDIGTFGGNIYVAGHFDFAGNSGGEIPVGNIAVFDGSEWSALGDGSVDQVNSMLVTAGGRVYASGRFDPLQNAGGVAEWTGTEWVQLGWDEYKWPQVTKIVEYRGQPVAVSGGGAFGATYGTKMTNGVATWDGTEWDGLGAGIGEFGVDTWFVNAVAEHDGMLYAGGLFDRAGDLLTRNLAGYDGDRWDDLGAGLVDGTRIHALASTPSGLVVGGKFSQIGGLSTPSIALWDGSSWQAMGDGLTDNTIFDGVKQLQYTGGTLYAAGSFRASGTVDVRGLARWTGSTWEPVGSGVGQITAMATDGTNFYVGAIGTQLGVQYDSVTRRFTTATGNVAHWDGAQWNDLQGVSGGTNAFVTGVRAMAMQGSDVIVGGDFTQAGTTPAKNIARWNGSAWEAIGEGIDGVVTTILVNGQDIYAGGTFTTASGATVDGVAKWDGSSWSSLGSGLYLYLTFAAVPTVNALARVSDGLALGGRFTFAGPTPSHNIAVWTDFTPVTGVAVEDSELPSESKLHQNYPNPFNPSTTVVFELAETANVDVSVFDLLGREAKRLTSGRLAPGRHEVLVEMEGMPSGVYLYRIKTDGFVETRRMILLK